MRIRIFFVSLGAVSLLLLSLAQTVVVAQEREGPVVAEPSCAPCDNLLAFLESKGYSEAQVPSLDQLDFITVEEARKAEELIRDCTKVLETCKREADCQEDCRVSMVAIKDFARSIGQVKARFRRADRLNELLAGVIGELRQRANDRIDLGELPPKELCETCDDLWRVLIAVRGMLGVREDPSRIKLDSLDAVEKTLGQFRSLIERLCASREVILRFDTELFEGEYRYFTWTETWSSLAAIRDVVAEARFKELCTSR